MACDSASNSAAMESTADATSFFRVSSDMEASGNGGPPHHRQSGAPLRSLAAMSEFATAPDGVRIAWEAAGEGPPVVLVHGFGASRVQNWRSPGWYDTLVNGGYTVVAFDCRGHGESDKPHDSAAYTEAAMANDIAVVKRAA